MSTIAAEPFPAPAERPLARMGVLVGSHGIVDFFSYTIIPILSVLEGRVGLSPGQGAILLAAGSIASGLIQPLTAWLGDRHDTRWYGTLGMVLATIAMSLLGFAHSYWHLLLIQVVGSAGVGAFHPPGVAAMGQMTSRRRSLGVSVFIAAGLAGAVIGTSLIPHYVKSLGVGAMAWFMIPGLAAAGLLAWAVHGVPHRAHDAHRAHAALTPEVRRSRWRAVGLIYAANAVRFIVNMMLVQLVIRWSERVALLEAHRGALDPGVRTLASTINGPVQSAMQIGMGAAGLLIGATIRERHERLALVAIPCVASGAVLVFPHFTNQAAAFSLALAAGVGYAGVMPITISMAQRLLPHRTGLASGIVMGGAWGLACVGPPLAQHLYETIGLAKAFGVTAALLFASGLLMLAMKRG